MSFMGFLDHLLCDDEEMAKDTEDRIANGQARTHLRDDFQELQTLFSIDEDDVSMELVMYIYIYYLFMLTTYLCWRLIYVDDFLRVQIHIQGIFYRVYWIYSSNRSWQEQYRHLYEDIVQRSKGRFVAKSSLTGQHLKDAFNNIHNILQSIIIIIRCDCEQKSDSNNVWWACECVVGMVIIYSVRSYNAI